MAPSSPSSPSTAIPTHWPSDITYLQRPVYSKKLSTAQIQHLTSKNTTLPKIHLSTTAAASLPTHISIRPITDPSHPAHGQHGLFATRRLPANSLVVPYFGFVHSNTDDDTDDTSDYDISLDRDIGVSVDAKLMGNEARMVNDYRGVPMSISVHGNGTVRDGHFGEDQMKRKQPNAEFRDLCYHHENGSRELGIGIFVMPSPFNNTRRKTLKNTSSGNGSRKTGIEEGEEILVNYGKGFWKERFDFTSQPDAESYVL